MSSVQQFVYILTNRIRTTLYIGSNKDLRKRVLQHKQGFDSYFTSKYNLTLLFYFESFTTYNEVFKRELRLKKWNRAWKEKLINAKNQEWKDLAADW